MPERMDGYCDIMEFKMPHLDGKCIVGTNERIYIMDIIKREQDFNVSLDYLSENEFFENENEYRFYMETILIRYISNCGGYMELL